MATRDRRDIQRALQKKGFVADEGDRHIVYTFEPEGKLDRIATIISRGSRYKVYGDPLLASIAIQLKVSKAELLEFVDCSLSEKDYIAILRRKGLFSDNTTRHSS